MSIERLSSNEFLGLPSAYRSTLAYMRTLEYIDQEGKVFPVGEDLHGHSLRVGRAAKGVGEIMWGADSLHSKQLLVAGFMHDNGKIDIGTVYPQLLDDKKSYEAKDEIRMRPHAMNGFRDMSEINEPNFSGFAAVTAALHHRFQPNNDEEVIIKEPVLSKIDETSGLLGISRREIMQMVLTVAVCDVIDAITTRKYVDPGLLPESFDSKTLTSWIRSFVGVDLASSISVNDSDLSRITSNLARIIAEDY